MARNKKVCIAICSIFICLIVVLFFSFSNKKSDKGIDESKVALTGTDISEEGEIVSLEELKEEADLIVYCETIDYISYMSDPACINSLETVKVYECIKGDIEVNSVINVRRMGGYVFLQDYVDSFDKKDREMVIESRFAEYTSEQMTTEYISQIPYGDEEIEIGKKAILFLKREEENQYVRIGDYQGEYIELADGVFMQPSLDRYEDISKVVEELNDLDVELFPDVQDINKMVEELDNSGVELSPDTREFLEEREDMGDIIISYDELAKK